MGKKALLLRRLTYSFEPLRLPYLISENINLPFGSGVCAIRSQKNSSAPQNLKQNSGLQKRKCNPRPRELAADLTGAARDAGESDCRIIRSEAAKAIKMQSKSRLPAPGPAAIWLHDLPTTLPIHISPNPNYSIDQKCPNK